MIGSACAISEDFHKKIGQEKNNKYFSFCESELVMICSFSITSKAGLKLNILCV